MRVVIADDSLIVREGLARLLAAAGIDVVDQVADAAGLMKAVTLERPDVAIIDNRMPPSFSNEGLTAAVRLASEHPGVGALLLSQYSDPAYVTSLLDDAPAGRGYLLKERVTHPDILIGALYRIQAGETVVDTAIVDTAVATPSADRRLENLTRREREVLCCIATGRTDRGICEELALSPKTVATHIAHIFTKLALPSSSKDNRRVHAVLAYLERG